MSISTIIRTIAKTDPVQLNVAKKPPIGVHKFHPAKETTCGTSFNAVATYVIMKLTLVVIAIGMINTGFIISGTPKIIGSLILKNAGRIPNLPTVLHCLDLENKNNNTARPKVAPQPPIFTNV